MRYVTKMGGIISCTFLFGLGLYVAALAEHLPSPSDNMKSDAVSQRKDFQSDDDIQKNTKSELSGAEGERTISGELFKVDNGHYFVKEQDGKETRLHTDKTTKMVGNVMKNDHVEAKVNKQNHALSIRTVDTPFK